MNRSAFSGFLLAAAVLYVGVIMHASKPAMFLDQHAMILVGGGTLAASLIAFRFKQLFSILDMLFLATLFPKRRDAFEISQEIMRFKLTNVVAENATHPFLSEAAKIMQTTQLDYVELERVLRKRAVFYKRRYQTDYKVLNAIAKFPPAFGLLGASTGMIEMMSKLGNGGSESIGSAMAIALVATFWGIALANLVFLPLADHANKLSQDDQALRSLIIDGLVCVRRGDSDDVLIETLRSYLNADQRKLIFRQGVQRLRPLSQPTDETKVG